MAEQGALKAVKFGPHSPDKAVSVSIRRHIGIGNILAIAAAAALLWMLPLAEAQTSPPGEYQVKAVYLYNFGKFVTWPAGAGSGNSFVICVLGHDPFGDSLDRTIAGDSINSQQLVAKRITTAREATGCRILFVSDSEAANLKQILIDVQKLPIVTVSDMPGFTAKGGMIQFVLKENRVRFEVNLGPAERAGLTFSSQLLKVAAEVRNP